MCKAPPCWRLALGGGCLLLLLVLTAPATAHFLLNINLRVIHVHHLNDGARIFLRLPLAYVLAARQGPLQADGSRAAPLYTISQIENGELMHRVDGDAVRADPFGLGQMVAAGHHFLVNDRALPLTVESVRASRAIDQPPFATLEEALRRFAADTPAFPPHVTNSYVGDTVVDVALRAGSRQPISEYALYSSLNPGLDGQDDTANLILDHYPGETRVFRQRGLLDTPITITRAPLAAALTFVKEGGWHILQGWDHVLFVLCLVIGAVSLGRLCLLVSGFTVGHTFTLIAGFLGFAPQATWFIPAVETGIALSIIYAAVVAVRGRAAANLSLTTAIGLLHGLGFAFVLQQLLHLDAPDMWRHLLSFNLGVEFGQLAIVILVWPLFRLLKHHNHRWHSIAQWSVALPCIAIATYWSSQRLSLLVL